MSPDTEQTSCCSQNKLRGICKLASKPKNHKDRAKVCLAGYNSEEAGQEAGNRENKWLRFSVDARADQGILSVCGRRLQGCLTQHLDSFSLGKQRSTVHLVLLSPSLRQCHPAPCLSFPITTDPADLRKIHITASTLTARLKSPPRTGKGLKHSVQCSPLPHSPFSLPSLAEPSSPPSSPAAICSLSVQGISSHPNPKQKDASCHTMSKQLHASIPEHSRTFY